MSTTPLLKIIQENAKVTDNKCGLSALQLATRCGLSFAQIEAQVSGLIEEGEAVAREGIHGILIFKNQDDESI